MSEISKNILNQIKDEKIKPKPKWQFVLINILLLTVLISSIILGAIVMSLVFLKIFDVDWDFVSFTGGQGLPQIFDVLPVLWLVMLTIVLILSVWLFEKTEGGYKYSPAWVVIGSVFFSTFFGAVLYTVKGAELVEDILRARVPIYHEMESFREQKFFLPEQGLLSGRLLEMVSPKNLKLLGIKDNKEWDVELAPELVGKPKVRDLQRGQLLLLVGEQEAAHTFFADDVRTKHAGGMIMKIEFDEIGKNRKMGGNQAPRGGF